MGYSMHRYTCNIKWLGQRRNKKKMLNCSVYYFVREKIWKGTSP